MHRIEDSETQVCETSELPTKKFEDTFLNCHFPSVLFHVRRSEHVTANKNLLLFENRIIPR